MKGGQEEKGYFPPLTLTPFDALTALSWSKGSSAWGEGKLGLPLPLGERQIQEQIPLCPPLLKGG